MRLFTSMLAVLMFWVGGPAQSADGIFQFETVATLDEMTVLIRQRFPLGTPRESLRQTFVAQGQATLRMHPHQTGVEKYIYDINLCDYYIWRWNISADYDDAGKLQQAYVNGNLIYENGKPARVVPTTAEPGKKASIFKMQRPRPEAYKGESSLGYLLFDRDSDVNTTHDQILIGAGPSRADPADMGRMVVYKDVDPWRSIFDADSAKHIARHDGDCAAAERRLQARERALRK